MTTFARIANGIVAELIQLQPSDDVADFFPADFTATLVQLAGGQHGTVEQGWIYDGGHFLAPPPMASPPPPPPLTSEQLLLQIREAQERLEALLKQLPANSGAG